MKHIHTSSLKYYDSRPRPADDALNTSENDYGDSGGAVDLEAAKVSLPAAGGTFDVERYVGDELAQWLRAEGAALEDPLVASLASAVARSCHRAESAEYAAVLGRLVLAGMVDLSAEACGEGLGLFGVWKVIGEVMRLVCDGRPANCAFRTPPFEHTSGDELAKIQIAAGCVLEVAKADLADFFHSCRAPRPLRRHFGLRRVRASDLRAAGLSIPAECVSADGWVYPRLSTLPMGWGPSPGVAQGAHEAVLYGSAGSGSDAARALPPVLDPALRLSSTRSPPADALEWHALVIDDVMLFRVRGPPGSASRAADRLDRAIPGVFPGESGDLRAASRSAEGSEGERTELGLAASRSSPGPASSAPELSSAPSASSPSDPHCGLASRSAALAALVDRYADVGLTAKPSKLREFAAEQELLGYWLQSNVLRGSAKRYHELDSLVGNLKRRGYARPREVERILGKFTHVFLLHRQALAVFGAAYAFARKLGHRTAKVWPSVLGELEDALALFPIVCSDLARPVAPVLLHTDASGTGTAAVYTTAVAEADLRAECRRPAKPLRGDAAPWTAEGALAAGFQAPQDPDAWRIAFRTERTDEPPRHINAVELDTAVHAVRWAARSSRTRRCRLVLQSDSVASVCALRKGRSSAPQQLRACRRLAAVTLAHEIQLEARWIPTDQCMADRPSRGGRRAGPCVG